MTQEGHDHDVTVHSVIKRCSNMLVCEWYISLAPSSTGGGSTSSLDKKFQYTTPSQTHSVVVSPHKEKSDLISVWPQQACNEYGYTGKQLFT